MKKFKVTIRLGTGDKIHALVEAKHKNEAKSRLLASQQYQEFVEGKEVVAIEIEHAAVEAQDNEKYIIKAIDNMHGWCCCIDTETTLRVEWRKGEYNEKQRSSFRTPPATALEAATAERQMADFLLKFFPELL